jgi:hypothetical protein
MLGRFFEPPAGEARQRVPGTRDPRHYDAENVRRNARAAGVATDSGHRSGIPILGRGLGHSSSPNLLHGQTLIRSRRGVVPVRSRHSQTGSIPYGSVLLGLVRVVLDARERSRSGVGQTSRQRPICGEKSVSA